ncbi:MAG TPA: S9 family peptidase [Vicinamibacterales bacterium]|jgi:dipeptidyl aminopeptidase/acylaminoacyl peptidase
MSVLLVLSLVAALQTPAVAAVPLTPEQTLGGRQISDLQLSPDLSRLVFVVTEPPKGNTRPRDIWMLGLASRQLRRMTYSPKGASSPRWSPDGKTIAFLSDREGGTQIHLLPADGGEATKLTGGKNSVQAFDWAPDGQRLAFLAQEPRTDAEEKREKDKDDARVVDKDEKRARLWVIVRESRAVTQLTSGAWAIGDARWAPDGERLIVVATDRPEVDQNTDRILSIPAAGGALTPLAAPKGPVAQVRLSPDGKTLAWVGARVDGPDAHDLYVLEAGVSAPRNVTLSVDRPVMGYAWRKDGSLNVLFADGFRTRYAVVDRQGHVTSAPAVEMNRGAFAARDDDIWFVGETAVDAPEIWHARGTARPEVLTSVNTDWNRPAPLEPEFYRYRSFDGLDIEAALLKPANVGAGVKLPLIVLIHGGPTGRWSNAFEPWGQLLAARGYAVFYPNIRGSVGYGHRFVESNRADWGGGDFKDLMAGVDDLIARGIADPKRLGIGGWSYGGYMSAWAITQTARFQAAVIGAGLSDLASEFGTENGSAYDEWFFGTPYEKLEGFIKCSPITYIKNARTPSLILQGEADTTDPIGQSQQLYRGLKRYGVAADFVVYPREGHGLREEKHLLDRLNRILAWYGQYIK